MLSKDALEIILDPGAGFHSRLFLVEKVIGGWRSVIDFSHLNEFVRQTPFKMETVASVFLSVREEGFPSFHRSEGREFPDTRSSVVEEGIEVPVGRNSLSVQGPVLPLNCSLVPDPQALFEDAFRHPWSDLDLYMFPPLPLDRRVVARSERLRISP